MSWPVKMPVNCGEDTHHIEINANFEIIACDHEELGRYDAMEEIGGGVPQCLYIIRYLYKLNWPKLIGVSAKLQNVEEPDLSKWAGAEVEASEMIKMINDLLKTSNQQELAKIAGPTPTGPAWVPAKQQKDKEPVKSKK